jgi:hypothetical protein
VSTYSELLFAALGAAKRMIPVFCTPLLPETETFVTYIELGKKSQDAKFAVLRVAALLPTNYSDISTCGALNQQHSQEEEVRQFNN